MPNEHTAVVYSCTYSGVRCSTATWPAGSADPSDGCCETKQAVRCAILITDLS